MKSSSSVFTCSILRSVLPLRRVFWLEIVDGYSLNRKKSARYSQKLYKQQELGIVWIRMIRGFEYRRTRAEGRGSLWSALFGMRKFRIDIERVLRKLKFREAGLSNSQSGSSSVRLNFRIFSTTELVFQPFFFTKTRSKNQNKELKLLLGLSGLREKVPQCERIR